MDVSRTAAEDDTFLNSCPGSVESIFHTVLFFLHLCLGSSADTDDSYAARKLCKALLQLFFVEIRLGLCDLSLDLSNSVRNCLLVALASDDDGLLLAYLYALAVAEHINRYILEFDADIGACNLTAGQNRNILKHILASVTIARSLDSDNVQCAAQLVDNQGRKSLAVDIVGDDEQLTSHFDNGVKKRKKILNIGNLLVRDENQRIFHVCFHLLGIGCHVCADIAAVKLHAFDQFKLVLHGLGFLDGNNTVLRNLLHCVGNHLADFLAAGRNRSDLLNMILSGNRSGHLLDGFNRCIGCLLHTLAQNHRVGACSQILHAFVDHRLRKNGSGRGAVACDIVCLLGNLSYELSAHVFKAVLQLDFLCNRDTIVCDCGSTITLVKDNISALRSKGDLYCIRKLVHACCKSISCIIAML